MSFLDYLDSYEKKFEKQVVAEQLKKVIEQKIVKENVVTPKKVIKIIKKHVVKNIKPVSEHINRAANILDGIEDCGGNPMMPSSSRFYDNTGLSSKQNINIESKGIASRANDLLSDLNDNSVVSIPKPLMNIPQMDIEMLKFVPKDMLTEEQRQQVQKVEHIENIQSQKVETPPELQAMIEQTKQMQNVFNQNIDTSEIPQELREYVNL